MTELIHHLRRAPRVDGHARETRPPRFTWTLIAAKLWLLAAFVGMSLVAVGAKLLVTGDARPAVALASGSIGAILAVLAWRRVARLFERADRESTDAAAKAESARAPERGAPTKLLLAPHR